MYPDTTRIAEHAVAIILQFQGLQYSGPKPNSLPGVMPFDSSDGQNRIVLVRVYEDFDEYDPIREDELNHYKDQAAQMARQLWVAIVHLDNTDMNPTVKDIYQVSL